MCRSRSCLNSIGSGDLCHTNAGCFIVKQALHGEMTLRRLAAVSVYVFHCDLTGAEHSDLFIVIDYNGLREIYLRENIKRLRSRMRLFAASVPSWKLPNQRSSGISSDP